MPTTTEIIFLGVIPLVIALTVALCTWTPWKPHGGHTGGGSGGAGNGSNRSRWSWSKDQLRSGAFAVGLAVLIAQLGVKPDFEWPLDSDDDHRLAVASGLTALALFAPTVAVPIWLAAFCRLASATGACWLITFVYRENGTWTEGRAWAYAALLGLGVAAVWSILSRVAERAPAPIVPLALTVLALGSAPIMIFHAAYITAGQVAAVVGTVTGVTLLLSFMRTRVTLGTGIGVAYVLLSVMLIDIVRVAQASVFNEPTPVPWWWAALLIASPVFAGAVLLPGIRSWHAAGRVALAAVLTSAAPVTFASIALAQADLSAYGIGSSDNAEPAW